MGDFKLRVGDKAKETKSEYLGVGYIYKIVGNWVWLHYIERKRVTPKAEMRILKNRFHHGDVKFLEKHHLLSEFAELDSRIEEAEMKIKYKFL